MKLSAKKIGEVLNSLNVISKVNDLDLDFAFEIAENKKVLEEKMVTLRELSKKIYDKYTPEVNGQMIVFKDAEEKKKYDEEMEKLNSKEIEVNITFNYFNKNNFSKLDKDGKKIAITSPDNLMGIKEFIKK